MFNPSRLLVTLLLLAASLPAVAATEPDWIARSNVYTQKLLDLDAKYYPETASQFGADSVDEEVVDLRPGVYQRNLDDMQKMLAGLEASAATEQDARVKQDLQILVTSTRDRIESSILNHDLMLPYIPVGETVFRGLQVLLDPRNDATRQARAIGRLQRYAGMVEGHQPLAELAKARTSERFVVTGLTGPYTEELNKAVKNTELYVGGLADMFREAKLAGWEKAHEALAVQLRDYDDWLMKDMMPRARTDNRLPEQIYADSLKQYGVTADPRQLIQQAMFGFTEVRDELNSLSRILAARDKLPSSDYRAVLRELKKKQIHGEDILPKYKETLRTLEQIIRDHRLVTLPARDSIIRLASEAESAAQPAPHMNPPRLIGNTGEYGEFVLPLRNPNDDPKDVMDDFTNEGFAWTLTAHESRPGHELQFSSMVETGVSLARAIYAFNSVNAEGWGLYSEALVKEYLPVEGQLFGLQNRLLRTARAFLDPMLNLGLIKPDEVLAFLMEEVVLSKPFATQEVDRYTFRAPGQATSYYFGYMKLRAIRVNTEIALRDRFDQMAFHDFLLAQGLLPPELLQQAIREQFIPSQGE